MTQQPEACPPAPSRRAPPLWRLMQAASGVLTGVAAGRSTSELLLAVEPGLRGGAQALSYQGLRQLGRVRSLQQHLLDRPPLPEIQALMQLALAVLLADGASGLAYTQATVVSQAVEAAKRGRRTRRQASLLNACLRRFLRERTDLLDAVALEAPARWNHPQWWQQRLQRDWPEHWQALLESNQRQAPLELRVNRLRGTVESYQVQLQARGLSAERVGPAALRLKQAVPVPELPGFAAGLVSVQSGTAQRAAPLLLDGLMSVRPRVLDACAAPGGKTAHLLEYRPQARLIALDASRRRSHRIHGTLDRLSLQAEVLVADAARPEDWWDGQPFDAILLDAPCSASGIVARHPDIRWLRRDSDIAALAQRQDALLQALWPLLAPGGRLLFCTCSVFREEGEDRIRSFLQQQPAVSRLPAPGHILPLVRDDPGTMGQNSSRDSDGFFYALLQKRSFA